MDQVGFYCNCYFLQTLGQHGAYETVTKPRDLKGSMNAYERRKVVGNDEFGGSAIDPIGNIADVSIYERDKRDERSFEFLNLFAEGSERPLAKLHARPLRHLSGRHLLDHVSSSSSFSRKGVPQQLILGRLILAEGNPNPDEKNGWKRSQREKYDAKISRCRSHTRKASCLHEHREYWRRQVHVISRPTERPVVRHRR